MATAQPVKMTDDERAEARASMQAILDNAKSHPAALAAAEKALAKLNGAAHEDPAPEPSEVVDTTSEVVDTPPPTDEATEQEAAHG